MDDETREKMSKKVNLISSVPIHVNSVGSTQGEAERLKLYVVGTPTTMIKVGSGTVNTLLDGGAEVNIIQSQRQ